MKIKHFDKNGKEIDITKAEIPKEMLQTIEKICEAERKEKNGKNIR